MGLLKSRFSGLALIVSILTLGSSFAADFGTSSGGGAGDSKASGQTNKIQIKRNAAAQPPTKKLGKRKSAPAKNLNSENTGSSSQANPDETPTSLSPANSSYSSGSPSSTSTLPGLTAGTSTSVSPENKKVPALERLRVGLLFEFYGPSVTDPFSGYQPDTTSGYSQGNDAQDLDTTFIIGYRASSNITLTLNPMFSTHGQSADGTAKAGGFRFNENYSGARITFGKFLKVGKFTWNGDLRVSPGGMGQATKERGVYFRNGENFMYSLTPRVNLAMYNTYRYYNWSAAALAAKSTLVDHRFTLSPAIEYQFSDWAIGSFSFNMDLRHQQISGDLLHQPSYFELGGLIDISKRFNLNPYIDIYPQRANVEAWQFGANLAVNIL
ncbi:MAG: hypothetical protein H7301_01200 [Cryobacterium sp.]|nr:hypothetical protein [Oligoflexia bacterium]